MPCLLTFAHISCVWILLHKNEQNGGDHNNPVHARERERERERETETERQRDRERQRQRQRQRDRETERQTDGERERERESVCYEPSINTRVRCVNITEHQLMVVYSECALTVRFLI